MEKLEHFPSEGWCKDPEPLLKDFFIDRYPDHEVVPVGSLGYAWNYNSYWGITVGSSKPVFSMEYLSRFLSKSPSSKLKVLDYVQLDCSIYPKIPLGWTGYIEKFHNSGERARVFGRYNVDPTHNVIHHVLIRDLKKAIVTKVVTPASVLPECSLKATMDIPLNAGKVIKKRRTKRGLKGTKLPIIYGTAGLNALSNEVFEQLYTNVRIHDGNDILFEATRWNNTYDLHYNRRRKLLLRRARK